MLVHCSVIYNVTAIVVVLNMLLMLMVRVEVASGNSSLSIVLWDIRRGMDAMVRWAHQVVVLRVET